MSKTSRLMSSMKRATPKVVPISTEMIMPNNSGDHVRSIKRDSPTNDWDLANKGYVDFEVSNVFNQSGTYSGNFTFTGTISYQGNASYTNPVEYNDNLTFSGSGSGLPFGSIYAHGNATTTTLALQDTFYQVTIFDTNGDSNVSTPDHTNDHITIDQTGQYLITCSMAVKSGAPNAYDFHIKTNNGTNDFLNLTTHRTTSNANALGCATIMGIADLTANDTLELWVQRTDGGAVSKSITIQAVCLSIVNIGG